MKHSPYVFLFALTLLFALPVGAQDLDLLIKGGRVIDPANGRDGVMDVGIAGGVIAAVADDIPAARATTVVDASGLIVTPGLIDLHAHVFFGTEDDAYLSNSYQALPPDGFVLRSGVTTVVDVGGAGWRNIDQFAAQTVAHSRTRVLSFLNIVGYGMKGGPVEQNLNDMDAVRTAEAAKAHPDLVVGIKLAHFEGPDWAPTDRAVEAGRLAGVPVMVDFGGAEPELPLEALFMEHLRPGDIFTHAYAHVDGRQPIVGPDGELEAFVRPARERGIVFDVGHGGGSFVWEQAVPATEQGFWPETISTDLHTGSMNTGMKTLANVMSKFLNLGMPLPDVVRAATARPADVIDRPDLGRLDEGAVADVAVFRLHEGDFGFIDTRGLRLDGTQKLEAELTLREGAVVWDLNGLASPAWDE